MARSPIFSGAKAGRGRTRLHRQVLLGITVILLISLWLAGHLVGVSAASLLTLTISGIMLGGILALGSIGLTLVYGVLKFPNFAHGALMTIGAYSAYSAAQFLPRGRALSPFSFGAEFPAAIVIAIPAVAVTAVIMDRLLFRPLRRNKASLILAAMASLAGMLFLHSVVYLIWGADFHFFYSGRPNPALHLPFGARVQADQILILTLSVVLIALVYGMLTLTRTGKAIRATADNPDLAQIRGINTERVITWTWIIGGSLAAIGGVMYGLTSQLRPEMGYFLLLPLFAATIMGGIGSPAGALAGSLIIGVTQELSAAFLDPTYGPAIAFVLMIAVLVVCPQGLFGKKGGG